MHLGLLRTFAGKFLNSLKVLAFTLGCLDPLLNRLSSLRMFMKIVIEILFEEIPDERT